MFLGRSPGIFFIPSFRFSMALAPQPWGVPHHTTPGQAWPGDGRDASWPGGSGGWSAPPGQVPWLSGGASPTSAAPAAGAGAPPSVDLAIAFLKRRDVIDKLLKLIRYAAKLSLATGVHARAPAPALAFAGGGSAWPTSPADPPPSSIFTPARLSALESSIGDARKAYRLGKWLQGVKAFREAGGWEALSGARGPSPALAALAAAGDGLYFFLEQGTWLVRARVAPVSWARPVSRASAAAELLSYLGSSGLALAALDALALREVALRRSLASRGVWPGAGPEVAAIRAELASLSAKRTALRLALLQDACDALLALSDLRSAGKDRGILASKPLLAIAGLVSAILGTRKVWVATVKAEGKMERG